jgi:hypothetical protein
MILASASFHAEDKRCSGKVLFLTQCGATLLRLFGVSRGHLTLDSDSKYSDLTDDQVLACGLNHCGGEMLELIDLEHSFHLGQQACN